MSRPAAVMRRISKNLSLPEDIVTRMELELYSEVEGRVPVGAQSALIEKLLRAYFQAIDNSEQKAVTRRS